MEVRARYALIGLFTLGVIALGFLFVFWLHAGGGQGQRSSYRIRYDGPVSGLLKGSAVLFNGVRVGEVTTLRLDPTTPSDVIVEIAVERQAPVRSDTKVGIDFQGLTGAPVVTLNGGSPALPLLSTSTDGTVLLVAEKNAGQGMTQAARDVLRSIDRVVTDNADPLRSLIANLDKFGQALARNSDRIDGVVAGIERFTGGTKLPAKIYDLAAAKIFPAYIKRPQGQLQIIEPTTLSQFDSDKVAIKAGTNSKPVIEQAQWPDLLPKVVQARLTQSFENAQFASVIGRAPENMKTEYQMIIDIRAFQVAPEPQSIAEIELAVRLVATDGRIIGSQLFKSNTPASSLEAAVAAAALSTAFESIAGEIVVWTLSLL